MNLNPRTWFQPGTSPYQRAIFGCLWAATFLLPFFFLPYSSDPLELNKAYLFVVLMLAASVIWLLQCVVTRSAKFRVSGIELPLIIFVLAGAVATIFSAYPYRSLAGTSGNTAESLAVTVAFVLFFFLMLQAVTRERLPFIFGALMLSAAVIGIINFFQVFSTYIFPWSFSRIATFNLMANSTSTGAVFFALVILFALMKALRTHRPLYRVFMIILGIVNLFLLAVYDQPIGWYVLILGLALMIVLFNASSRRSSPAHLLLPALGIGIAILGLVVPLQTLFRSSIPADVALPSSVSRSVAWQSVLRTPLVGSGQGTYDSVLGAYRPVAYNTSSMWNLRFVHASNLWLHLLSTIGVIGTLAFAIMVLLVLKRLYSATMRLKRDDAFWWYHAGTAMALLLLVAVSIMMTFSFVLMFLLWLFLAAGVILLRGDQGSGKPSVRVSTAQQSASFVLSLAFSLFLIVMIVVGYYAARFWIADYRLAQANAAVQKQEDLQHVQNLLTWSVDLNPYEQGAYFDLSQGLLVQAQLLAQEKDPDLTRLRALITASVASAQTGASKYASSAASYQALSALYASIDTLSGTTSGETKAAYEKVAQLEPNNPNAHMSLGQYYLTLGRSQNQKANAGDKPDEQLLKDSQASFATAKDEFQKAVDLKADFLEARINIALALRLGGNGKEAVVYLEDLAAQNPFSTDVLFNLSENYLLDNRQDDAMNILTRVIKIFPGHSDAHARLADIYEKKSEIQKAIDEMMMVKRLNPTVKAVDERIAELKVKLK